MNITNLDNIALEEFSNHEKVIKFTDEASGLIGFLAIHNTNLGPAVGGTRMFPYASEDEALADVLGLSKAMTYKCAISGVPYGGGKAVIMGDPDKIKTPELLSAYAEVINYLDGQFYTGEDVGISEADVQYMLKTCPFFIGHSEKAGDPSPYASLSTYYSMQTAVMELDGSSDLSGKKIAIKGVGKVGGELARLLSNDKSEIYVSDIKEDAIQKLLQLVPTVIPVDNDKIKQLDIDIYAPCALSNELSLDDVSQMKAKIICGAANRQLSKKEVGESLFEKNILYIVDYVANCGGLINVVDELEEGGYNKVRVLKRIDGVHETVKKISQLAREQNRSTSYVADQLAESIFL
ncbi:MAG: Glu/Leu/Phe/Val dehydrogenase dimerization domain-containing protein [bacterium]|nr:Glu/Leu/Phe/Val dehydrogenase dimerization domain-containing protein [bacterium]